MQEYDCSMSNYARMIPEDDIKIHKIQIDHEDPL